MGSTHGCGLPRAIVRRLTVGPGKNGRGTSNPFLTIQTTRIANHMVANSRCHFNPMVNCCLNCRHWHQWSTCWCIANPRYHFSGDLEASPHRLRPSHGFETVPVPLAAEDLWGVGPINYGSISIPVGSTHGSDPCKADGRENDQVQKSVVANCVSTSKLNFSKTYFWN